MYSDDHYSLQVSLAEALWANFTAEHNLAFALSDHATKIFGKMFPDSDIAKRFASACTKTMAVVTNLQMFLHHTSKRN